MVNRYAGEIRINPISVLRNDDFNNDGHIKDMPATLKQAIEVNQAIGDRLQQLQGLLAKGKFSGGVQFHFADGGYISITGLPDSELLKLNTQGLIHLFDNASDKTWVKKHGQQFGLIWEDGRAVAI